MNWLNTPLLFKTILDLGVLFVAVLLMITVGLELEGRHFREVGQRKWSVGLLLGGQVVLLPLLGIAVAQALDLPPHLSAGILLVAACPVGDIANFYTLIARGNAALSLVLNTLSCLSARRRCLWYSPLTIVYFPNTSSSRFPLRSSSCALF